MKPLPRRFQPRRHSTGTHLVIATPTCSPAANCAYYCRLQLGFSGTAQNNQGTSTTKLRRNEGLADFSIDYGMLGKPGYEYTRPFDYFNFQGTLSSANGFENSMTRGLLIGKAYSAGTNYRGVWVLYGNYDYIAPQTFRISTTGFSLGTTGQWWLTKSIALHGTALLGTRYAAVGTSRGTADELDYHDGVAPQALLSAHLIVDGTAAFDITARQFHVTHSGIKRDRGYDNSARVDASLTWRVWHQHAFAIKYLHSRRDASFPELGERRQSRATVVLFYTLLGQDRFAAVDWRRVCVLSDGQRPPTRPRSQIPARDSSRLRRACASACLMRS